MWVVTCFLLCLVAKYLPSAASTPLKTDYKTVVTKKTSWSVALLNNLTSVIRYMGIIQWQKNNFFANKTVRRSLTGICSRSQPYCVCCDEEELETVEHLLCNCLALSKLSLRILGRGFLEGLNSVSSADIKALHIFISGLRCLRSARASSV